MLKFSNENDGGSGSGGGGKVKEAYLISVDEKEKRKIADQIQAHHPSALAFDMEDVHNSLNSGHDPVPFTRMNTAPASNNPPPSYATSNHFSTSVDIMHSSSNPHYTPPPPPPPPVTLDLKVDEIKENQEVPSVAQVFYGYDNQPKISPRGQTPPRDYNYNTESTLINLNDEDDDNFKTNENKEVFENSVTLPDFGGSTKKSVTYAREFPPQSPPPTPPPPPPLPISNMAKQDSIVNHNEGFEERMKEYEEELKKRKEREEEQAFLRSSLRGSKKLQALEEKRQQYKKGEENRAYETSENRPDPAGDGKETENPIGLEEVMMSVNRVTKALEKLPEHRKDSEFLKNLFQDQEVQNAIEMTASLNKHSDPPQPTTSHAFVHSDEVLTELGGCGSEGAVELQNMLGQPPIQATLYAPDQIATKQHDYAVPSTSQGILGLKETTLDQSGDLRIIKLLKQDDHYLGATVKEEGERIVVGRIVKGGVAEKSKVLKENDEILEVNGVSLKGKSVAEVCDLLRNMTGEIVFVVHPSEDGTSSYSGNKKKEKVVRHMRALFDYDPEDDMYVPCRELALKFQKGDILHVLSMEDGDWWQAFREGEDPTQHSLAGLIPSTSFQTQRELYRRECVGEKRRDYVSDDNRGMICGKKNKRSSRKSKTTHLGAGPQNGTVQSENGKSSEEVLTYEEVSLFLTRSGRKRPLVLVGPPKVGCLELRGRLMETDKDKFCGVVPHTSRPRNLGKGEEDGVHYYFVSKQKFQDDVREGKFVEWGEFQKHFYGTSFNAIQRAVERGRTCILALQAQSLKRLRESELMPFIVFISPPSLERLKMNRSLLSKHDRGYMKDEELRSIIEEGKEMEEVYGHYFDKVIVNIDLERSFQELRNTVHRLETEPHWVPSYWLRSDLT